MVILSPRSKITPLASDGAELTDTSIDVSRLTSARLALRDDSHRPQITARNLDSALMDPEREAVAQRAAERRLDHQLAVAQGDVIHLLAPVDAFWWQGKRAGRAGASGRVLRTVVMDYAQLMFAAEWCDDALAQWELGWRLIEGWSGFVCDGARGIGWLKRAASQGLAFAQYSLGFLLDEDRPCIARDPAEARRMTELSAAQGFASAQFDLALVYHQDNDAEAFALCRAAAEQGLMAAMEYTAYCYRKAKGVPRDVDQAEHWLAKTCAAGCASSMRMLGRLYYDEGPDMDLAVAWMRKAVAANDAWAVTDLAWLYSMEDTPYTNLAACRELGTRSAARGGAYEMKRLAECLAVVFGEYEEAAVWYDRAAAAGDVEAREIARRCYQPFIRDFVLAKIP